MIDHFQVAKRPLSMVAGLVLFVAVGSVFAHAASQFPTLTGDYLGQKPPGDRAALFAPGIVSTGLLTRDVAMTPDGNEFYFCVAVGEYSYSAILVSKRIDGRWTEPEVAPFSANPDWAFLEPAISPDGQRFFFLSDRPEGDEEPGDRDIWVMDRQGDNWGEPYNLGPPVNSGAPEYFPSVTYDGTLYFTRSDPETRIDTIWRSRLVDGEYQASELLGETVNSGRTRFNAFIAPDESYLIVPTYGRDDSFGATDYYICFRDEHDNWTGPFNMGDQVNSENGAEYSPYVSPDGKYFFFMSGRTGAAEDDPPASYA
ncbi:MAG: hypothetical protein ABIF77_03915 [bacterium]